MKLITVYSKQNFDQYCEQNNITDDNVETFDSYAFISINDTEDCNVYCMETDIFPHFKRNHSNVLVQHFDDVEQILIRDGFYLTSITDKQAKEMLDFIMLNKDKEFIIHCRVGKNRSYSVGKFIKELFNGYNMIYDESLGTYRGNNRVEYLLNSNYERFSDFY